MAIARAAAWILVTSIVVLSLVPPDLRPVTAFPDYVEHFGIYVTTGLALWLAKGGKTFCFSFCQFSPV
jgi:hypothetical protein